MADYTAIAGLLGERIFALISETLAEHGGGIVNAFVLGLDFLDADGDPSFILTVAPDQRILATAGLAVAIDERSRAQFEFRTCAGPPPPAD